MSENVKLEYTEDEHRQLLDVWGAPITTEVLKDALLFGLLSNEEFKQGKKIIAKHQQSDQTIHIRPIGYKAIFDQMLREEDISVPAKKGIKGILSGLYKGKNKKKKPPSFIAGNSLYQRFLDTIGELRGEPLYGFDPNAEKLVKKYIELLLKNYKQALDLQDNGYGIILDSGAGKLETIKLDKPELQ